MMLKQLNNRRDLKWQKEHMKKEKMNFQRNKLLFGKGKQFKGTVKELEKKQAEENRRKRNHRLIEVGAAVESVLGKTIEKDDIPKLIGFLNKQEQNGKYFSTAMGVKETNVNSNK